MHDDYLNFRDMKITKINAAPMSSSIYRPALMLRNGAVLWHPEAHIHADVITMNFDLELDMFDFGTIKSSGGLDSSGAYWQMDYECDLPMY